MIPLKVKVILSPRHPPGQMFLPIIQGSVGSKQPSLIIINCDFLIDSEKNMSGMTDQFQDATLSSTKKGGIFGGKNKFTDPFFIGPSPGPSHDDSIASVDSDGEIVRWAGNKESFSISVGNPEKSSKLGGMKTFIQYQITPTNTGRGVLRRYKHFDWLHEQLTRKYAAVAIIPPLPGKQASGRFDDDFVTDRMSRLQCWSVRMCRHPLMSSASVFQHFLTSSGKCFQQ